MSINISESLLCYKETELEVKVKSPYSSPVYCCALADLFIYTSIISKAYFSRRDAHRKLLHSMYFPLEVLVHLSELDDLQQVRAGCTTGHTLVLSRHVLIFVFTNHWWQLLSPANEMPAKDNVFSFLRELILC